MTRCEAKALFNSSSDNAITYKDSTEVISISSALMIIDKIYDEFDTKHEYIIELIAHTEVIGNKFENPELLIEDK